MAADRPRLLPTREPVETTLEQFVPAVYRFALRLSRDAHLAEDLTQETFVRAWRRRAHLRELESVKTWLFRIVVNLWSDELRRRRVRGVERCEPVLKACDDAPSANISATESLDAALRALDRLPERQRAVLYLHACAALSAPEIALVLAITPEAVRSSLSLARQRMRGFLMDEDRSPTDVRTETRSVAPWTDE